MPRAPHSQTGLLASPTAVSKYGSVLKLLRTGTLALPFQDGHAHNTRGFRSASASVHVRKKICGSGSADIRVRTPLVCACTLSKPNEVLTRSQAKVKNPCAFQKSLQYNKELTLPCLQYST